MGILDKCVDEPISRAGIDTQRDSGLVVSRGKDKVGRIERAAPIGTLPQQTHAYWEAALSTGKAACGAVTT